MQNTATVIQLIKLSCEEKEENNELNQWQMLCLHGRTMVMMFKATGNVKYLEIAKSNLRRAKSIKECGFVRPMGVLLTA